jgi:hypothetical protein
MGGGVGGGGGGAGGGHALGGGGSSSGGGNVNHLSGYEMNRGTPMSVYGAPAPMLSRAPSGGGGSRSVGGGGTMPVYGAPAPTTGGGLSRYAYIEIDFFFLLRAFTDACKETY